MNDLLHANGEVPAGQPIQDGGASNIPAPDGLGQGRSTTRQHANPLSTHDTRGEMSMTMPVSSPDRPSR
jgi:hypothetical protein